MKSSSRRPSGLEECRSTICLFAPRSADSPSLSMSQNVRKEKSCQPRTRVLCPEEVFCLFPKRLKLLRFWAGPTDDRHFHCDRVRRRRVDPKGSSGALEPVCPEARLSGSGIGVPARPRPRLRLRLLLIPHLPPRLTSPHFPLSLTIN